MTQTPDTKQTPGPFTKAFQEARAIIIVSFVIAITYNVFAATSIPWIREPLKSDRSDPLSLSDGTDTLEVPTADTSVISAPLDTIPIAADTAAQPGLSRQQLDSLARVQSDSIKLAKAEAAARADSIRNAGDAALFERLATASEIETDVAKRLFDSKKALFIDARPEDHFREGHIRGAKNVYAEQWQTQIPELVQIPREQIIVTYCGGGDECELSHDLAKNLKALGFKTVVVYMGGIKAWTDKKYPIATGQ